MKPAAIAKWAFLLLLPALIAACSNMSTQSAADRPAYPDEQKTVAADGAPNVSGALASANGGPSEYRIAQRDILDVTVFQVPDLTKTIQVSDDGNISLPLIGKTPVGGKTTHEAETIIAGKLSKKYLRSPQVTVFVRQYGQRVTVSGEVKTPQVLALEGYLTLSQAVAKAGGLSDLAEPKRVHVARAVGGKVRDEIYNYDEIQAGHTTDPMLQGGDLVVAEQSGARVVLKNLKDMLPFAVLASII